MSSTSNSSNNALLTSLLVGTFAVGTTAFVTYTLTKRNEEYKHQKFQYDTYQRDLRIREKTILARREAGEPPTGTLIDVRLDRVYLWEVEDLRKRFPGTKIYNKMRFQAKSGRQGSPLVRRSLLHQDNEAVGEMQITEYNKLITNHECIIGGIVRKPNQVTTSVAYVRAGPRKYLHFDPKEVSAAIVTCGGLCPGLNNCIREITKTLHQAYGIGGKVYGIQAGYHGFSSNDPHLQPIELTPELVENIHHQGGTVLGSSRGGFDLEAILGFLKKNNVKQLYVIGGDGTHRGAFRIHEGCMEHGLNVSVAGIPKTIDNDIDHIDHTFGFASAVEAAQVAIRSAKTEAVCNLPNGIGIVKLMGRSAGYIAAHSTMASGDVDLCLVPEVPLVLEGELGCLPHLYRRVKQQGYAVVVVAEGAGEEVLGTSAEKDASGNKKLPKIGEFMKAQVEEYFKKQGEVATVKYIDPSYTVRSVPANAADSLYCMQLGQNAVHGAMAGFTGFSVGLCNNRMVFLPIPELVATSPRNMNPRGRTWERVLALTRQPNTVLPPNTVVPPPQKTLLQPVKQTNTDPTMSESRKVTVLLGTATKDPSTVSAGKAVAAATKNDMTLARREIADNSLEQLDLVVNVGELNLYDPMELAGWVQCLQEGAVVTVSVNGNPNAPVDAIHSSFVLAGLKGLSERREGNGTRVFTASKPSALKDSTGAVTIPKKSAVRINVNDDDDDMIDEDELLENVAPPPAMEAKATAGDDCGGRTACDDCTCGRSDQEAAEKKKGAKKSSCGKCGLGDAFRCASCPYLGMPAFKPGEEPVLLDLQDDV